MSVAYINGKIFTGEKIEENKAVLTDNEVIVGVVNANAVPCPIPHRRPERAYPGARFY